MEDLLILQLIAHLLADFYFQTDKSCKLKNSKGLNVGVFLLHGVFIFILSWVFSFSINYYWFALLIAVTHILIDVGKKILKNWKPVFYVDQLLHILVIITTVMLYDQIKDLSLPSWLPQTKYLLFLMSFLICLKPTNVFIKYFLKNMDIKASEEAKRVDELERAGRIIGSLERILTLIFVIIGQYSAIGFLMATKSILRFKDTATAKTEYVLIGTLLSYGVAIILGLITLNLL